MLGDYVLEYQTVSKRGAVFVQAFGVAAANVRIVRMIVAAVVAGMSLVNYRVTLLRFEPSHQLAHRVVVIDRTAQKDRVLGFVIVAAYKIGPRRVRNPDNSLCSGQLGIEPAP